MAPASNHVTGERWYSISVTVAPESAEAVEYAFNSLDALGTEINHLQKKNSETVTVVGYFNELPDDERFQDELHYALRVYGFTEEAVLRVERSEIADADWLLEWKKHWKPSDVGAFVIAPPWSDVEASDKIVIRIEPNMAFGTGTHETTQLCLQAIEKYYEPADSFLDVGTGTGILAIAAARLYLKSQISHPPTSAPNSLSISITPARVGFKPTFRICNREPFRHSAATKKNAEEEMSDGTTMLVAISSLAPLTLILFPLP